LTAAPPKSKAVRSATLSLSGGGAKDGRRSGAEVEVIRLSRDAQEKFTALLLHPPAPGPALKKAFDRHRSRVAK
jgi:hypothetical protein